jgi:hypothetical protein
MSDKLHPAVKAYLVERARRAGQVVSPAKTAHCQQLGKARQIQDEFTDLPISRQAKYLRRKKRDQR